jgi:hypothetical protein
MRKQQVAVRALWLVAALGIGSAYAGEPAGGPPPGKSKPPGAEAARDKGDHDKGDHGKHEHGKPDEAAADAKDKDKGPDKDKGLDKDKANEGRGPGRRSMHELWAELKAGKLKKGDLKARLGALREQRDERIKEHREELKARFGAALGSPAVRQELEHHARRMAKLDRAMELCETEVKKDQDKLKERIQKLIDKEKARHEKAMERFKSGAPGAAAAAAAAPAAPATPPAAVAIEKGAEK